ncbi:unnamed protein product, partial [Thlaspi arvense]
LPDQENAGLCSENSSLVQECGSNKNVGALQKQISGIRFPCMKNGKTSRWINSKNAGDNMSQVEETSMDVMLSRYRLEIKATTEQGDREEKGS